MNASMKGTNAPRKTSTARANASGTPSTQRPMPINEASTTAISTVPLTKPPSTTHALRPARSITGRVSGVNRRRIQSHNDVPSRRMK